MINYAIRFFFKRRNSATEAITNLQSIFVDGEIISLDSEAKKDCQSNPYYCFRMVFRAKNPHIWFFDELQEALDADMIMIKPDTDGDPEVERFLKMRTQMKFLQCHFSKLLNKQSPIQRKLLEILIRYGRSYPYRIANLSKAELGRYGITDNQFGILKAMFSEEELKLGNVGCTLPALVNLRVCEFAEMLE